MFSANWTTPCALAGTLRFTTDPRRHGLGIYKDVDGVSWDVRGIMRGYIQARKVGLHQDFYSTATTDASSPTGNSPSMMHQWEPYNVEVIADS